jgi:hypothetical protein
MGWLGPPPRPRIEGTTVVAARHPPLVFENGESLTKTTYFRERRCSPERAVVQRTNAQRLRGPPCAVPKPVGTLRLLCVGDSHTFGDGVADDESWPAHLGRELSRRHPGRALEVINAGVNGYETVQEVLWIEQHLLALEPDGILLQYFANDAGSRQGTVEVERGFLVGLVHPRRGGSIGWLRRQSALADALGEALFQRLNLGDFGSSLLELYDEQAPGWLATRSALTGAAAELERRDIAFGVVLYPLLAEGPGGLASHRAFARVREFLERHDIEHFDGEPTFLGRDLAALRVAPGDMHAGAAAHALFAASVADWLDEHWLVD